MTLLPASPWPRGALGDPTSTNESLTNFFDRKTIGLDRGYITYNPVAHRWVSVTGGKFAYTWNRTPMTFDSDINPEGFSEKFSFDLHSPVLKNVTVMGMQLHAERSFGRGGRLYAIGGQGSAKLQLGRFWATTASFTALKFNNIDYAAECQCICGGSVSGRGPGLQGRCSRFPGFHRRRQLRLCSEQLYQRRHHHWDATTFTLSSYMPISS